MRAAAGAVRGSTTEPLFGRIARAALAVFLFVGDNHYGNTPDLNSLSRWDTANYVGLLLRGYKYCPARADLTRQDIGPVSVYCKFDFYPGFAVLGWLLSMGGRFPADYSLWGVSLIASFLTMMMWTSRTMVRALGLGAAYCSVLLLNTWTTGFMLATPQTEPATLALTLGAKQATARFTSPGRVFIYTHFIATMLVIIYGTAELLYAGTTRYTLVLIGGFMGAAMVFRRQPVALLLWLCANIWHYWYVDMCFYAYHYQPGAFRACMVR